ncbi:RNA polymerase III RPC4-domain-containing protein [Dipodascopsis tothii]|uniref:RNA polymerase III RPC4-domain-containing protein n=1 Tax=Dipodascopsis tothii TaxID=44089 RepID=UPI0034CF1C96
MAAGPFANPEFGDPKQRYRGAIERMPSQPGSSRATPASGIRVQSSSREATGTPFADDDSGDELGADGLPLDKINLSENIHIAGEDAQYFPVRDEFAVASAASNEPAADEDILSADEEETDVLPPIADLEQKLFFFQFGPVLPQFEPTPPEAGQEFTVKAEDDDPARTDGFVGRLFLHRSGKVSMRWGGLEMQVAKGADAQFLQDVVVLDHERDNKACLLGQIQKKLVVTLDIDNLFPTADDEEE